MVVNKSPSTKSLIALGHFLRARETEILEAWSTHARDLPPAKPLTEPALINHLPEVLQQIAGEDGAVEAAKKHATTRAAEGFELSELVHEYAILRDCAIAIWERDHGQGGPELHILSQAIDLAILAAVRRYGEIRDRVWRGLDAVSLAALESKSLDELLRRFLEVLLKAAPAIDSAMILLRENDGFRVRAAGGIGQDRVAGRSTKFGENFLEAIGAELGLKAILAVKLTDGDQLIGYAHIGSLTAHDFSTEDKYLFELMATRATSTIAQRALRARLEADTNQQFLAETSTALSESLDLRSILEKIAAASIPFLADGVAVWIRGSDDGTLHPAVTVNAEGVDPDTVHHVVQSGLSLLDPKQMVVTLRRRAQTIGAITFLATDPARNYQAADLHTAEELARRSAIAIDNAWLYEEARRAVEARDEILAVVTHDLRNPLQAINMSASLILRITAQEDGPRSHRRHAELIQRAGNRMARLVEDLIDFASIERGELKFVLLPNDPVEIAQEAVESFTATAQERGLTLCFECSDGPLQVSCDRARILQVLDNLISNAINVTDGGGTITVSLSAQKDAVRFSVHDSGPGIPAEFLERIFERYVRREETQYRGRGLGLAIARGIISAHGGKIWAESRPGEGARFSFELARAKTTESGA